MRLLGSLYSWHSLSRILFRRGRLLPQVDDVKRKKTEASASELGAAPSESWQLSWGRLPPQLDDAEKTAAVAAAAWKPQTSGLREW